MRDEKDEGYGSFLRALRRFALRGLVWSAGWAVISWLAYVNVGVYGGLLSPFGAAVVQVAWIYALIYLEAMQPYLLEALTVEEAWLPALKRSAWQVLANPVYSHAHLLLAAAVVEVGSRFVTLLPVLLVAVVLVFWAVAAAEVPWKYGERRPVRRRGEDVL